MYSPSPTSLQVEGYKRKGKERGLTSGVGGNQLAAAVVSGDADVKVGHR